ncbi:hypothetical protein LAZ67_5002051 [Cordylochernes scorpioides]|uniref:Endonuclease n=1 Tax=Cordylochernes scorpioides TaxID=51811 RepID=A0ABY6KKU8_9ARAC|nr:hypothetical protein LAZ67_5002051 [Cordylochernes scorpioides]
MFKLLDSCNEIIRTVKVLGYQIDSLSEVFFVKIIQDKLDKTTRKQWELQNNPRVVPSIKDLMEFLEIHAKSLQNLPNKDSNVEKHSMKKELQKVKVYNSYMIKCLKCEGAHALSSCNLFSKLPESERVNFVSSAKLCFRCLKPNHLAKNCYCKNICQICKKRHHTLIHQETKVQEVDEGKFECGKDIKNKTCLLSNEKYFSNVMLTTARIKIKDNNGVPQTCRALIDSGSQANFISGQCRKRLGLEYVTLHSQISGISGHFASHSYGLVEFEFTPHFKSDELFKVNALVLDKLTNNLPTLTCPKSNLAHLKTMPLADPDYNISAPIDILIGAELAMTLFTGESVIGDEEQLTATFSKLGLLLSGRVSSKGSRRSIRNIIQSHHACLETQNIVEKLGNWNPFLIYVVQLPFRNDCQLRDSRSNAIKRLCSLERSLIPRPEVYDQYRSFIKEYLELGHMSLVPKEDIIKGRYYLPHHPVIKEKSCSTKLRVVFDASAKTDSGLSLNDALIPGPKIQQDLFYIILRFRIHPVAINADIAKMYRKIRISQEDSEFQRIVWRNDPHDKIKDYRLETVTYGTSCAPFLATRIIKQLALDEQSKFPKASKIALTDFYVDDLVTGSFSVDEGKNLVQELYGLLSAGGFELRKWTSNVPDVLSLLPNHLRSKRKNRCGYMMSHLRSTNTNIGFEESKEFVNVLGLQWQPRTDGFTFKGIALPLNSMTKRGILSQVAKIFDPLGWISPFTTTIKLILQELWKTGLEWDDPIPEELRRKLTLINQDLPSLEHIQIPRCVVPGNYMKVEFHGFCDASQKAYAASLYLKVILSNKSAKTFLLVAKTRVAPMKVVSLPKLELCSALLLARLVKTVYDNLPLTINEIYLWSDSTIALCWINSEPCRWKTFVANRVAEIHRLVSGVWCHVDGRQNPADCASRGIFPSDLVEHPLWWNGPPWLIEPALEIKKFINSSKEEFKEEEKIKTYFGTIECEIPSIVINCSSLTKLKCIIAWCLRFVNNSRMPSHSRNREPLTLRALNDALLTVVKCVQSIEFSKEKHCLLSNKPIPNKSRIYNLCAFLDSRGIIRVGGRLKNVNVYGDRINQVLLPRSHHLTTLIVNNVHVHNLHSSTQATLAAIRNIFWIPSGRNVVRKILRTCMKCARFRPFLIKRNMGRTTSTMNAYVALFICFSTRAIHLELISSLTTDALISTIRRFIARRGKPATIYSDNATNFVGAHKIIGKLCHNASKVLTNSEGIQWKFIPPSAPHFDGLWEAGVKSMKYHLRRTMGSALLNFEELTTLLDDKKEEKNASLINVFDTSFRAVKPFDRYNEISIELSKIIKQLALSQYPPHFIHKYRYNPLSVKPTTVSRNICLLPFSPQSVSISRILRSHGINTYFSNNKSIGTILRHPITRLHRSAVVQSSGGSVYSVSCNDCNASYIGETGRSVATRMTEHGGSLTALPDEDDIIAMSLPNRWQLIQKSMNHFWTRWSQEYVSQLQQRSKWCKPQPNIKEGSLVLIKNEQQPPLAWKIGRISKVFPGDDARIRVVEVKTANGTYRRPILNGTAMWCRIYLNEPAMWCRIYLNDPAMWPRIYLNGTAMWCRIYLNGTAMWSRIYLNDPAMWPRIYLNEPAMWCGIYLNDPAMWPRIYLNGTAMWCRIYLNGTAIIYLNGTAMWCRIYLNGTAMWCRIYLNGTAKWSRIYLNDPAMWPRIYLNGTAMWCRIYLNGTAKWSRIYLNDPTIWPRIYLNGTAMWSRIYLNGTAMWSRIYLNDPAMWCRIYLNGTAMRCRIYLNGTAMWSRIYLNGTAMWSRIYLNGTAMWPRIYLNGTAMWCRIYLNGTAM